jgi:2-aminoadipate transaminase
VTDVTAQTSDYTSNLLARRAGGAPAAWNNMGAKPRKMISFTYGLPDEPSFPSKELAEITNQVMSEQAAPILQYGYPRPLAEYLAGFIKKDQGLDITADNILITAGSGQAISLFCRLTLEPGDYVVVEAPTFLGAVKTFQNQDAQIAEAPMDDEGLIIEELDALLTQLKAEGKRVKFIYTIPTFQNPTGRTLGLERRKALIELAHRHEVFILEDDAYHGLLYQGEVPSWLWTLDPYGIVFHCGTLSKTLAPGMRLGWIGCARPELLVVINSLNDGGPTSSYSGYVAAKFAEQGLLAKHTRQLIDIYRRKRDRMLAGLERYMPDGSKWTEPQGGFFIWLELPEQVDTVKILGKAQEAGVNYLPGSACYASGKGRNCIRLAFSLVKLEEIEPGLRTLGEVISQALEG